jgi:hypothetical protein
LLESFIALTGNLSDSEKKYVKEFARAYTGVSRKSTAKRARKLLGLLGG